MKNKKSLTGITLFILMLPLLALRLHAQSGYTIDSLSINKWSTRSFHYDFCPFDSIIILDNRFNKDQVIGYIEDGKYPPKTLSVTSPLSQLLANYIGKVTHTCTKAHHILLINIQSLRTFNQIYSFRKNHYNDPYGIQKPIFTSNNVFFSADLYLSNDDQSFRKFITIQDASVEPISLNFALTDLMNKVINACTYFYEGQDKPIVKPSKHTHRDVDHFPHFEVFHYSVSYSFDSINITNLNHWGKLPIYQSKMIPDGVYNYFEDFRDNLPLPHEMSFIYNEQDSLYTFTRTKQDSIGKFHLPYAVAKNGKLYIHLVNASYVQLVKTDSSFYFNIPHSIPNMYAIQSAIKMGTSNYGMNSVTGNSIGGLVFILMADLTGAIIKSSKMHSIIKDGKGSELYRHCFIDMNNGDFVY